MLTLPLGLTGCRQTDFLKDIVMAAWADIVDDKTPLVVNNPDAETPNEHLPAFDIADVTEMSDEFQNIVVYASNPNTVLVTTRHSVFDLSPRFTGIEASDPVRFVFGGEEDDFDQEVTSDFVREVEAQSISDANSEQASEEESPAQGAPDAPASTAENSNETKKESGSGAKKKSESSEVPGGGDEEGPGEGGSSSGEKEGGDQEDPGGNGGEGPGEGGSGDSGDEGDNKTEEPSDGRSARESGGYDGEDITYDPGNRLELPRHSDHVAAIGQTAVIAQAVGGKGAVVGMDEYTFKGLDSQGRDSACATSFSSVFGDELADGFAENSLLWTRDGMVPGDVVSIESLVAACADSDTGAGGTIVFPSDKGSQADYFSSKQLESFQAAGIQLVPIDMGSPQGIIDGFVALGEVLTESDEIEQDSEENAEQFRDIFNDIIDAATKSRSRSSDDATLAANYEGSTTVFGEYYEGPSATRFLDVWATVADGFEARANYAGSVSFDASGGLLFSTSDISVSNSPLSLFMQAAGVVHLKASDSSLDQSSATTLLNPLSEKLEKEDFRSYSATGPMSRMTSSGLMDAGHWSIGDSVVTGSDSVGSSLMPYLIVAGDAVTSGEEVKRRIVEDTENERSVYALYKLGGSHVRMGDILASTLPSADGGSAEVYSALGCQHDFEGSVFHDRHVAFADCVRINPNGLIGSWMQGTPEAVLECAWLVDLYSKYPQNSDYGNVKANDASKFKVTIGGRECTDVRSAVESFYGVVYRCDVSELGIEYADIVPDSGEGLC